MGSRFRANDKGGWRQDAWCQPSILSQLMRLKFPTMLFSFLGMDIGPIHIAIVLIAMNFAAFFAFGIDKLLAQGGSRRISEAALLQFALFGGIVGAYAGRSYFRHKTRKQPFNNHLTTIAGLQICAVAFLVVYFW